VKPLAPEHYKIQFTISRNTHDNLFFGAMTVRERQPEFVSGGFGPDRADGYRAVT